MTGGGAGTIIIGVVIMGALVYKAADLVKYIAVLALPGDRGDRAARAGALNGILTLVLGSVLGVGIVFLMDVTSWTNEIKFGTLTLVTMSFWEKVVLGLVLTSLASTVFDFKKAVDRTDTASTPDILPAADKVRRARLASVTATTATPHPTEVDAELRKMLDEVIAHENTIEEELHELAKK
ncbi:MAG TPA: hypothetical protein VFN80_03335 [Acidothermaceae bacterium]|nr:hypothetical protein [Acidothermaceae bacterium]